MLQAAGLTKKYGDHLALDGLDLNIAAGEIFCLLGANGAGKTTTINLFLDFIRPSSGEARIDGKVVAGHGGPRPPYHRLHPRAGCPLRQPHRLRKPGLFLRVGWKTSVAGAAIRVVAGGRSG